MAFLLFLAAFSLVAVPATVPQTPCVRYLVSEPTTVRVAPADRARAVAKLKRFDIVTGCDVVAGWLHVEASSAGVAAGWIPLVADNVITVTLDTLKRRIFRIERMRWSERIKVDIARGRIRNGFTADQVQLALGEPLNKQLVHAGENVSETWIYDDRRVTFSHTGVRAVEDLNEY
jgi:hypothetical protein